MAAPKGNQFAKGLKNSGRPKKFKTPEIMQAAIDKYFAECDNNEIEVYDKNKQTVVKVKKPIPYTIEGLAETIDFTRQGVLRYESEENYKEFHSTIKKAKLKIQRNKIERALNGDSHAVFSIFDLKNNHGYLDNKGIDLTTGGEKLNPSTIELTSPETDESKD